MIRSPPDLCPPSLSGPNRNGWLSPEGTFHPCTFTEHRHALEPLGLDEFAAERLGWKKLQQGFWIDPLFFHRQGKPVRSCSQRQLTAMHEVSESLGLDPEPLSTWTVEE